MKRMPKKTLTAPFSFGAITSTSLAISPPAEAAPMGWIYISAPTWLGNCAGGQAGKMVYMQASVGNTWTGGDLGDDILYVKVRLNEKQQVSYSGFCSKGRIPQPGVGQTIKPTRNNQTIWLGPSGVRY